MAPPGLESVRPSGPLLLPACIDRCVATVAPVSVHIGTNTEDACDHVHDEGFDRAKKEDAFQSNHEKDPASIPCGTMGSLVCDSTGMSDALEKAEPHLRGGASCFHEKDPASLPWVATGPHVCVSTGVFAAQEMAELHPFHDKDPAAIPSVATGSLVCESTEVVVAAGSLACESAGMFTEQEKAGMHSAHVSEFTGVFAAHEKTECHAKGGAIFHDVPDVPEVLDLAFDKLAYICLVFGALQQEASANGDPYVNEDDLLFGFLNPLEHVIPLDEAGQDQLGALLGVLYRLIDRLVNVDRVFLAHKRDVEGDDKSVYSRRFLRLNSQFVYRFQEQSRTTADDLAEDSKHP